MKLVNQETTLVIAGAWNPAILTPSWILKNGLGKELDGNNRIEISMPVDVGAFQFPRYTLEDLQYTARTDALVFFPGETTEDRLQLLEKVAARILDQLGHTPVSGVGHNFEFQDEAPSIESLQTLENAKNDLIDIAPKNWNFSSSAIITSLKRDETTIINIHRYYEGTKLGVKFNFHHPISSVAQGSSILRGQNGYLSFFRNYLSAKELIEKLYGKIKNDEDI